MRVLYWILFFKRREDHPPLPTEIQAIVHGGAWASTISGQPFILHKDDDQVLFTTDANLRIFAQLDTLYIDSTF